MINLIATEDSWRPLLDLISPPQRFYCEKDLDSGLVKSNGMPILFDLSGIRFHVYPPTGVGAWAERELAVK